MPLLLKFAALPHHLLPPQMCNVHTILIAAFLREIVRQLVIKVIHVIHNTMEMIVIHLEHVNHFLASTVEEEIINAQLLQDHMDLANIVKEITNTVKQTIHTITHPAMEQPLLNALGLQLAKIAQIVCMNVTLDYTAHREQNCVHQFKEMVQLVLEIICV